MFDSKALYRHIQTRLAQRIPDSFPQGARLLSVTLTLPEVRLDGLPPLAPPFFFWGRPDAGRFLLGLGIATSLSCPESVRAQPESGADPRLLALAEAYDDLRHDWHRVDDDGTERATAFAVLAFDPEDPMEEPWAGLPNCGLFFPTLLLCREGRGSTLTFTGVPEGQPWEEQWSGELSRLLEALAAPEAGARVCSRLTRIASDPDESSWLHLVERARDDIQGKHLEKVVPARRVRVRSESGQGALTPARLMGLLGENHASSTLIAADLGGPAVIAATPERLAVLHNGELASDAVGGTIGRSRRGSQDSALAQALLDSVKARHEHALVVDFIRRALEPLCSELEVPAIPNIIRLRHLQHLWTPIRGRPDAPTSVLHIAARLHPTPAVSGMPVEAARKWLREHESIPRGWYTGSFGWIDAGGEGELSVLLRCAVLNGSEADLFAGAGIVADSDPRAELEETELKLETVLEALRGT